MGHENWKEKVCIEVTHLFEYSFVVPSTTEARHCSVAMAEPPPSLTSLCIDAITQELIAGTYYNHASLFSVYIHNWRLYKCLWNWNLEFETLAGDDALLLLQTIYDFPLHLLDTLITRLPPLALHKFHHHLYVHFLAPTFSFFWIFNVVFVNS